MQKNNGERGTRKKNQRDGNRRRPRREIHRANGCQWQSLCTHPIGTVGLRFVAKLIRGSQNAVRRIDDGGGPNVAGPTWPSPQKRSGGGSPTECEDRSARTAQQWTNCTDGSSYRD